MAYNEFVAQNEADDLFSAQTGNRSDPISEVDFNEDENKEIAPGVRLYNLGSPDRVVRKRMQTLELINERFMRQFRTALFNFMRRGVDVSIAPIKIMKYEDFERHLPVPSNLNMVTLKPLRGMGLFAFDPQLVFLVIDSLFGGTAKTALRVEGRDFTATEQRIIQRLLTHTLECYVRAWEPVYPISAEYVRSEMHTKFATVAGSNEAVVVTPVHIEFGSSSGVLNICLPYSMIEPVRDILTKPFQETSRDAYDVRWSRRITSQVKSAQVELACNFAQVKSSIGKLLDLQVGDVLKFELPEEIEAHIGGVPVFKGQYGIKDQRYALKISERLSFAETDFNQPQNLAQALSLHTPLTNDDLSHERKENDVEI